MIAFKEISPNPYNVSKPVTSKSMFFGRQDIIDSVVNHLNKKGPDNIFVIHGERRIGKTSILFQLRDYLLSNNYIPVHINMHAITCKGTDVFFYNLSEYILGSLERENFIMESLCHEEFQEAPEAHFKRKILEPLEKKLDDRKIVLMFDEFEELYKLVEDRKIDEEVLSFLESTIRASKKIYFIFTGAHQLKEIMGKYWSALLKLAIHKKVDTLSKEDTIDLMVKPVAKHNMQYQEEAKEYLFQMTGGHPYFVQLICHELVEYHNQTRRSNIETDDINKVLERVLDKGDYHFRFIWGQLERNEKIVLGALAQLTNLSKIPEDRILLALAKKHLPNFTLGRLLDTLDKLCYRDVIVEDKKSLYRFKVNIIGMWIAQYQKL